MQVKTQKAYTGYRFFLSSGNPQTSNVFILQGRDAYAKRFIKFHFVLPKKKHQKKKAKTSLFLSLITIVVKVLECMNEDEAKKSSVSVVV